MADARFTLTEREAYNAMLHFLEAYFERGGRQADEIAILLGGAQMNSDGLPMDPAFWQDWLRAIAKARAPGG